MFALNRLGEITQAKALVTRRCVNTLDTIAGLMSEFREGDAQAAGRLVEALYPELRRMAAAKMSRERPDHTWQPTALVNEIYVELTRIKGLPAADTRASANDKAAFLSLAGRMMERRLIDHARPLYRRLPKLTVDVLEGVDDGQVGEETLQYIEGLLAKLSSIDARFRTVVECRVFMGMTLAEIAERLGCSERTAATHWSFARRWLATELDRGLEPADGSSA